MTTSDTGRDETEKQRFDEALGTTEATFVWELFDALAREDREAYELILSRNQRLREKYGELDRVYADLREAFAEGPDPVREKYPELSAEVDGYFQPGTLTKTIRQMVKVADTDELRDLYKLIARTLVAGILERIGGDFPAKARSNIEKHLCEEDVLERFKEAARRGEHVRDALIDELASALDDPNLPSKVDRAELQDILDREDVIDQFYGLEACIVQLAA